MIKKININIKKLILSLFFIGILIYSMTEPLYIPTAINVGRDLYIFPEIIAHQAKTSEDFPGNSLSAIKQSLSSTIPGIEIDLKMSKDGMLFLYHGDLLEEYTDHIGSPENYKWDNLSQVRYRNTEERLVSLDDLFSLVGTQKVIFLNIKSNDKINTRMVKNISDTIKKYNLQENVFVESFNPITLILMRLYSRDIMLMYNFIDNSKALDEESNQKFNKIPWLLKRHWVQKQIRRIIRPDILGPRFNINQVILNNLIQHGYPLICWTVDESITAESLYESGVQGQGNCMKFKSC